MAINGSPGAEPALIHHIEKFLFGPATGLQGVVLRRNSSLLARLLAVMIVVFALLDTHYALTIPGYRVPWYGYLFLVASFACNRAGWYRISSWLVMLMFPVTIFVGIVSATTLNPVSSLNFLFLSLVAGGILLGQRSLTVYILLEVAAILSLPLIAPRAIPALEAVSTQLVIMVIGGFLVLLWKHHRNVIERERQAQLSAAERKYRGLIETTDTGYVILDDQGRVLDANEAYVRLAGRARMEEVLGHSVLEWTAPHHHAFNAEQVETCARKGFVRNLEIDYLSPDGKVTPVEVNATLLHSPDGESILSLCRDITGRKRVEEALLESERRFHNAFSDAPIGMAIVDVHERFLQVNEALCSMLGYAEEQLLAATVPSITYPDDVEVEAKYKNQTESGGLRSFQFEKRYVHADGHIVWGMLSVSAVTDETGRLLYYIGQLEDISERKRAEAALELANTTLAEKYEELRKVDAIKDGLLRDVTHELKTPVAKQAMQIELLRGSLGTECTARTGRIIEVMEQAVRRQEAVIRNLLNLARLEDGGRRSEPQAVRADGVMKSVLEEYRSSLEEAGIALSLSLPPTTVVGDEEMLWHVFSNLVTNAIKFRKRAGRGRLEISAGREGKMQVLRFRDEGIGMTPEELERAFERFYQATPSAEGSGVGLSICRLIVGELGGTITLDSAGRDRGATAVVRLLSA